MQFNIQDLIQTMPLVMLLVTGLLLMLSDAFNLRSLLPWLAGLGLTASLVLALPLQPGDQAIVPVYNNMFLTGGLASFVHIALCLGALFSLFFIQDFFQRAGKVVDEIYAILVFSVIGMIMLANSNDLAVTFIGLETMSICLYVMAALLKNRHSSNEAGLKYFLLGSFATGFLLFGMSMLYGITGTTQFTLMSQTDMAGNILFLPAVLFILIGFLFKVSAFPFHNWTPDVYQGTPTPLAGFMATASKTASFIALGMFLHQTMPVLDEKIFWILVGSAVISMVYGNIVAARQTNLKRLLAYSSIAHTGYVLLGLASGKEGFIAVIFYAFIYTIMNVGAFGLIGMNEIEEEDAEVSRWNGIGLRKPWFGVAMSVFLFSLAGIPPLAGFMSKYQVFFAAVRSELYVAAIIGVLASVVGAYYYIRVIVNMYFTKSETETSHALPSCAMSPTIGVFVLAALTLALGIFPSPVYTWIESLFQGSGMLAMAGF
jgi:NADH-quinone oxidoreductase subunit N